MGLKPARHRSRSAVLPSLGGVAVIGAVMLANGWSLLTSTPELAPMQPLQRLDILRAASQVAGSQLAGDLPATAEAGLGDVDRARSDASAGAALPLVSPMRLEVTPPGPPQALGLVTRSWVVQPGEGLGAALARLHVHGQTARDVSKAYGHARDPQKLQAGWRLWARFETAGVMDSGALLSVVIAPGNSGVASAASEGLTVHREADGAFVAREGGLPGTLVRQALRCGVLGTLEETLRRCGEGDGLLGLVQPVLGDRLLHPVELRAGDELRLVLDKLMDGDTLVRYQTLAALEHRSVDGERTVALHFADGRGTVGYFDAEGRSVESMLLRQPLRVGRTTSGFGMRLHPILHRMKAHYGVDYGAARGTPVWAAGNGQVLTAARAGAAGNLVRLKHADGYTSEYMHLQRFAAGLSAGDRVAKGDVVGYVGSTGRSTGPHLHFGIRHRGRYLDPMTVQGKLPEAAVPARDRKAFDSQAAELLRLLAALEKAAGA